MGVFSRSLRAAADRRGNVGIAFALVMVPIIGVVGAAIDYTRARNAAENIQVALDNAALAAARDADDVTKDAMLAVARRQIEAHLGADPRIVIAGLDGEIVDETVWLQADIRVRTTFLRVLNVDDVAVSRFSEATYGRRTIEIALVLDNTGSMGSQGKMRELKRALCGTVDCGTGDPATGFVHVMREAARGPGRVRVGLVPFDIGVRVPLAVQDAVRAATPVAGGTVPLQGAGYCSGPGNPGTVQRVSWLRFAAVDEDATVRCDVAGRPTPATWDGCIWDRDKSPDGLDATDAGVDTADPRTLHPAVNCRNASFARMAPLADVWTSGPGIVSALGTMQPSGNTNVTIGAAWGMAMLTSTEPFTDALPPGSGEVERFMILLTDGDNTENKFGDSRTRMDERTEAACESAKSAGITVVTVRVINGNRNLLRDCASAPDLYYEVARASDLGPVFDAIARRIGSIRLTQ